QGSGLDERNHAPPPRPVLLDAALRSLHRPGRSPRRARLQPPEIAGVRLPRARRTAAHAGPAERGARAHRRHAGADPLRCERAARIPDRVPTRPVSALARARRERGLAAPAGPLGHHPGAEALTTASEGSGASASTHVPSLKQIHAPRSAGTRLPGTMLPTRL